MLQIVDLSVEYGAVKALRSISVNVDQGEIVCLLGANGAGKSTLINAISGIVPVSNGDILFEGQSILQKKIYEISRLGIIQCPEGRRLFADLKVHENLLIGASCGGYSLRRLSSDVDYLCSLFPILRERWHQMAGTLSGGEQQMVAIARSVLCKPRILLLDEPGLGLAPAVCKVLYKAIDDISRSGINMLIVEQNVEEALKIASRGYILSTGSCIASGEPDFLRGEWEKLGPN